MFHIAIIAQLLTAEEIIDAVVPGVPAAGIIDAELNERLLAVVLV